MQEREHRTVRGALMMEKLALEARGGCVKVARQFAQ